MFGLGTLVNTIAVVVGGIIGLLFKNGLKNRYQETIMQGIGLAVLFVGISGAMTGMLKISKSIIESTGSLILVLSLCFGALIGEFINIEKRIEFIEFVKGLNTTINELDSAEIIVAGGKGLKNEAGFALLKNFAESIGACVGASRGAVDMGLASADIQIGQTGKTVTPKLYIACGISGAIQHIVGMQDSDKIIAINTDEKAPIFEHCDCGIVGDAFEILPKLTDIFKT